MKYSKIEWCDHTFNPWIGCTKKSPGCKNCYALARDQRFAGGAHWGPGAPRQRTSPAYWRQPLRWNRDAETIQRHCAMDPRFRRPRVFCASLADWLDEEVPIEWLADLLSLIHRTPNLDWLLLTKRPENWLWRMDQAFCHAGTTEGNHSAYKLLEGWLGEFGAHVTPGNIWIGTTTENQEMADERIPLLLEVPAKIRFLSCEPLLGPVNLRLRAHLTPGSTPKQHVESQRRLQGIKWVICGGESSSEARPMHPDWALSLRDQCQAAGVPFLFKQWGEWLPYSQYDGDPFAAPAGVLCDDQIEMLKIGKKTAGRLLDGREFNEFPA